jgi:hypothetical protein
MSHLFASLEAAARLVVKQDGYRPGSINRERWATTYRVSPETIDEALKIAENGSRKLPEEISASAPVTVVEEPEE